MKKDEIIYEKPLMFKPGDVVCLKSGSKPMTVLRFYHIFSIYDGQWICQWVDRIKQYSKDGTAIEYDKLITDRIRQEVLELVPPKGMATPAAE